MQASVVYIAKDPPKQARVSTVLINYSTTAAATAIPSNYFALTIITNCSILLFYFTIPELYYY